MQLSEHSHLTITEQMVMVRLEESDSEAIRATKQDMSNVASILLEQYARGGVMVPPVKVRYMSDMTKTPIVSANDIVDIVENQARHMTPAGDLVVSARVDPAFVNPLCELANAQGRTVDAIVEECLRILLTNSWLYALPLGGGTLTFSSEMRERMENILGTDNLTPEKILVWAERLYQDAKEGKSQPVQVPPHAAEEPEVHKLSASERMKKIWAVRKAAQEEHDKSQEAQG